VLSEANERLSPPTLNGSIARTAGGIALSDTYRFIAIGVCVVLNMLDGFDVLVISLAGAGISREWDLTSGQLGLLFSTGLCGMVIGSFFVAPIADQLGRRAVVLTCTFVVGIGMLLSGRANNYLLLAACRLVTGIGIAGILACAVVMVSEYSTTHWRNTAIFIYTFGYSLGATLGGAIAAELIHHSSWRAAFLFGGAASLAMLPVAYRLLPESTIYLASRKSERGDTTRLRGRRLYLHGLLNAHSAKPTILLWIAFFFAMGGYYFVFNWTPKLLTVSGLSAQQGVNSGVLLSLGGMGGTILFAFVGRIAHVQKVAIACLLASAVLMVVFALHANNPSLTSVTAVALGGASTSALAGFYALTPALYGADVRSSGMGWAVGTGRIGAILASLTAGNLVDHGWSPVELYCLFAGTFLLSSVAILGIGSPPRNI
jgi:MFS family permease